MPPVEPLTLSEAEWRRRLSPPQYRALREAVTEAASAGRYADTRADGVYHCAACRLPLFDSADKFEADTG